MATKPVQTKPSNGDAPKAKRQRKPDPWLAERANIIAAHKASGARGIPAHVKERDFQRLVIPRTRKAVKAINQLRALSNPSTYGYNSDQVSKVLGALSAAVEGVAQSFEGRSAASDEFSL
jgi:hypothetical protein